VTDAPKPENLEPVSDETLAELRGPIAQRLALLLKAYHRGMIVARDDDERSLLNEIAGLVGRPDGVKR
jgi:hypothetical protein